MKPHIVCLVTLAGHLAGNCAERVELDRSMTDGIGLRLTLVPAGEFLMGSPEDYSKTMAAKVNGDWYRESALSEWPQRRVKIAQPFYLGACEVRLAEFKQFIDATGYVTLAERDGKGGDGSGPDGKWTTKPEYNWRNTGLPWDGDRPVMNVAWLDAAAFCEWLTKKEGARYRLPTEAEWEYACRAGTSTPFYWGDDESQRNDYAWSPANAKGAGPQRVGQLKPNAWGLYDMTGNVYEYCSDYWTTNLFQAALLVDPTGPRSGEFRAIRSASWGTNPLHCRSAFRGSVGETQRNCRDGFRVVRELGARK
ncbi:MAG: formylglycine-generating enzyme family protein [Verrucomicrobiales bacterium]|nr:formylglycine-generating enzyme family protein [Verrucomicrobiales bacterium]